jgi:hypothetical protein
MLNIMTPMVQSRQLVEPFPPPRSSSHLHNSEFKFTDTLHGTAPAHPMLPVSMP